MMRAAPAAALFSVGSESSIHECCRCCPVLPECCRQRVAHHTAAALPDSFRGQGSRAAGGLGWL